MGVGKGRKQDRPPEWGKKWFLEQLAASEKAKKSHAVLYAGIAAMTGGSCTGDALKHEVIRWRQSDEAFRKAYYSVAGTDPGYAPRLEERPGMEDWKIRWCEAFIRSRKRRTACQDIGVSLTTVNDTLNPKRPQYDPSFVDLHAQAMAEVLGSYEADVEDGMQEAREQGDAKTMIFGGLEILSRLDRDKWARNERREVYGEVRHTHQLAARQEQAVLHAAAISQRLFGPPPSAGEDVVEAELVEERTV